MTYNFKYTSREFRRIIEPASKKSHRFDEDLHYRVFNNAYIAPYVQWTQSIGCVIGEDGVTVHDSECIEWKENAGYYNLEECVYEHKKVVFLGFILTGFGHSYTDDLRKLWFLNTKDYTAFQDAGYELVYTTSWNSPIPKPVFDMFMLAGFNLENACHITQLTRFDEIIVPDNCYRATDYGRVYCQEYESMINRIKDAIPPSGPDYPKLYFTRTLFSNNSDKEQGEEGIEKVFRKLGYKVIIPENHSVIEQLQMVRNCSDFASTEGSVSHLSLFCRKNTNVCIINKANYLNFHQVMVNEFADLNVTYIEAHHSSKAHEVSPWWGPFYLCVNRYMECFAHRPIPHIPYWLKFSYWKYTRNLIYKVFNRTRKTMRRIRDMVSQIRLFL